MTVSLKNRHQLNHRDVQKLFSSLKSRFPGLKTGKKAVVETGFLDRYQVFLVDNSIDFFMVDTRIFFTVRGLMKYQPEVAWVVVDMGAVGFIVKGADIMVPGIVDVDSTIQEGEYVWVCDEQHHKPLAVGIALMSGEAMKLRTTGKAVKNIHYVGDDLWKLSASG
ncbi:MAG: RNA-binding protein [Candidatus Thermoplasmatota archaeon]